VAFVILAGTLAGVHFVEDGRTLDIGGPVTALVAGGGLWAATEEHSVLRSGSGTEWEAVASITELAIRCLLPFGQEALAGTSEAHLYRVGEGQALRIEAFEDLEGRDGWYTPWGGPPDTRSLAESEDEVIYANVHVGGIPKSEDGGMTWRPTIDVEADVHQVTVHEDLVLAACATGLATSSDHGETWRIDSDGMHGRYCRAVTPTPDAVLVSASTGPFTKQAAVYRRPLRSSGAFQKCVGGLPEWFGANVDSHCLVAHGERVALGTGEGEVWVSEDQGGTWSLGAKGLAGVSCLAIGPGAR